MTQFMTTKTATTAFDRESDLELPVARFLRNRRFHLQQREMQFYDYHMDVYGYSAQEDVTVAVELKLLKWTRAFEQARRYQLCSDLVYVAMPTSAVQRVDQDVLRRQGIGLIAVGRWRCREVLPAVRSAIVRPHYRAHYVSILRGGKTE